MTDVLLDFARHLHISVTIGDCLPEIFLKDEERLWAKQAISDRFKGQYVVGIHPGGLGNSCNLPASVYGEVANLIFEKTDWGIIVTGNPLERSLIRDWPKNVFQSTRCWLTHGLFTIRQLTAIIAEMKVLLCSSTGPLHIASAVKTSTVSPFCPIPYRGAKVWGNIGGNGKIIEGNRKFCREYKKGYTLMCDFYGQITADQVFAAICSLSNKKSDDLCEM
jgi:ADP-heptose:LPS heptosyltransferase